MTIRSTARLLVIVVAMLVACGTTKGQKAKAKAEKTTALRLRDFADDINKRVQRCAAEVNAITGDPELKRTMIRWQIATLRLTQRSLHHPDPRWTLLELWAGLFRIRAYLERPDSTKDLGSDEHAIVRAAIDAMLLRMERRSATVLNEKQLDTLRDAAGQLAAANPLSDEELRRPATVFKISDNKNALALITNLPADIFSLGGGVKDTAMAVTEVAEVADRGVDGIESMPQMVRWQTQLLLMDLEQNESVKAMVANSTKVSDAVERVSKTVETLPAQLEDVVVRVAERVEKAQPELRETLKEGRGAVVEARGIVQDIGPILEKVEEQGPWLERTTANATEAGKAWEGAFHEIYLLANPPLDPNEPPPESSPPFDMKDYLQTAEWTTKAAVELRATVVEVRGIIDGEGLDRRVEQVDTTTNKVLDAASAQVRALIDTIAWRAGALIVLFFALLAGYRMFATRLARP